LFQLQRLLSSGTFYYSSNPRYDITSCSQRRSADKSSDARFFWNRALHFPFERFGIEKSQWLLKCMAGSVLVRTVYVGHLTGRVALLSRLSCERVGTRFNVRGTNSLGCVANFVETEQVIVFDESECSLVQVRGSVPLFWEQPGVQVGSHKVKLRAFEASGSAYYRHMSRLTSTYGKTTVVNLLGRKEGERVLADAFRTQHKSSKLSATVDFIDFDYHYQMKISKDSLSYLIKKLAPIVESNAFYLATEGNVKRYAACLNLPLLAF
uniref:Phosphatidylinositol-3-phosphatase SAC1 n=1 Tax=Heligmosomoides polygyrus TaxID=6339 RepID=A0A183FUR6_HELPZ